MAQDTPANELSVCFWNILSEPNSPPIERPQSERLADIIKTLQEFPSDTIYGLAEVKSTNRQLIAKGLGCNSEYFVEYDYPNHFVGALSKLELDSRVIQLDEKCRVVLTEYKGLTIVFAHFTYAIFGEKIHKRQVRQLLSELCATSPAIIMGDFNSMAWQGSRKLLEKSGFRSTLGRSIFKRIPTAPTKKFRHIYSEPLKTIGLIGYTIDDVYVRGVEVLNSGTFEGESDHLGVWATLRPS